MFNPITAIKAFFTVKGIIKNDLQEAKTMENKPGWKKTEFWIKTFTVDAPIIWGTMKGFLPPDKAAYVEIAGLAVFAFINTVQKFVENWKAVKLSTVPAPAAAH